MASAPLSHVVTRYPHFLRTCDVTARQILSSSTTKTWIIGIPLLFVLFMRSSSAAIVLVVVLVVVVVLGVVLPVSADVITRCC
jgi:hypothetical protein